jgi:hypothetical protein
VLADFAAMGVTVDLPPDENEDESDVFPVWDKNWPALTAFLALETQWRVVARGMTGVLEFLGLDYAAVDVVLRRRKAKTSVFEDLQAMEGAALSAFREVAASEADG